MIILQLVFLILLLVVLGSVAFATLSAAPWVPLPKKDVRRMVAHANIKPGETVYDLGCGDGRVLIEVARAMNAKAIGFEISILMYVVALLRVYLSGQSKNIKIHLKNFYKTDFKEADVILCFLTPNAMRNLKTKVESELKFGARFLSYVFPINGIKPKEIFKERETDATIYLYSTE